MSDSSWNIDPEELFDSCDSRNCIDITIDLQGDNTIRPPRPEYVQWAMAERERHARLMELWQQQQEQEKAGKQPGAENEMDQK